jgi:hypothetical protein
MFPDRAQSAQLHSIQDYIRPLLSKIVFRDLQCKRREDVHEKDASAKWRRITLLGFDNA